MFTAAAYILTILLSLGMGRYPVWASDRFGAERFLTVSPVRIQVNGEIFQPRDAAGKAVAVFAYQGTTYAPLRALAEVYGLGVGYDADANMAAVNRPAVAQSSSVGVSAPVQNTEAVNPIQNVTIIQVDPIRIQVNGQIFQPKDVNGNHVRIFAYQGTTYAPLRALAEAYGLEVGYDADANMATVNSPNSAETTSQTVIPMYSDCPEVPDFGAWCGLHPKSHETDGSVVTYMYDTADMTAGILDRYQEALEMYGFVQMGGYDSDEGYAQLVYGKDTCTVSWGLYHGGSDMGVLIRRSVPDSGGNGEQTVPVYQNYPDVPDFGALCGISFTEHHNDGQVAMYSYHIPDITLHMLEQYENALDSLGFTRVDSDDSSQSYPRLRYYSSGTRYLSWGLSDSETMVILIVLTLSGDGAVK